MYASRLKAFTLDRRVHTHEGIFLVSGVRSVLGKTSSVEDQKLCSASGNPDKKIGATCTEHYSLFATIAGIPSCEL